MKGYLSSKETIKDHAGGPKKSQNEAFNFITVHEASNPIDLKISLRPSSNNFPDSVLGQTITLTKTQALNLEP